MAKQDPLLDQKMFARLTWVKSNRYRQHARAARGTYKKATLNAACKKHGKELIKSNGPAKLIKDALAPYRQDISDGSMWSRLLSAVKKALSGKETVDFKMLSKFEINEDYKLMRFFDFTTKAKVDNQTSKLQVTVTLDSHPGFGRRVRVDGYRFKLIGIFPDIKKRTAVTETSDSDVIKIRNGQPAPIILEVPVPPRAKAYVACLRLDGYFKGKEQASRAAKGMAIVSGGVM